MKILIIGSIKFSVNMLQAFKLISLVIFLANPEIEAKIKMIN